MSCAGDGQVGRRSGRLLDRGAGWGSRRFIQRGPRWSAIACQPERSRALSMFTVGGFLGQARGPSYSGLLTTRHGLPSLGWGVAWGLPLLRC